MKVLITESLSKEGVEILSGAAEVDTKLNLKPEELIAIAGDYEALVVRSQTQVSAEVIQAGKKLQVIARAGVGVDNIDVDEATQHGIVVVNAPTANTTAAAEHTMGLILSLARHIPQANALLKSGIWQRSNFIGIELKNRTLGIIGLGNVGSEIARMANGLDMRLIAYDPFISTDQARNLKIGLVSMQQLLKKSDFITLHVPLTKTTEGIIGSKELEMVKPEVRIVNTARGGLVDEVALVKAIEEGRVAGAAFDVFNEEPVTNSILFETDGIIVTPHLGASTTEAQAIVARDIAEQIVAVLTGHPARYAVNAPFIPAETLPVLAPFIKAAATAGQLASQLTEGQMSSVRIKYDGEISNYDTTALKVTILRGLLEEISEERVNLVNANLVAARRSLTVVEQKETTCENYTSLITIEVKTTVGSTIVATTVMRGETNIVRVNDYWINIVPDDGYFLFCDHLDHPGLIGAVGKMTGDANININAMYVGRLKPRGQALMILSLDEALPEEYQQKIMSIDGIDTVKLVRV